MQITVSTCLCLAQATWEELQSALQLAAIVLGLEVLGRSCSANQGWLPLVTPPCELRQAAMRDRFAPLNGGYVPSGDWPLCMPGLGYLIKLQCQLIPIIACVGLGVP